MLRVVTEAEPALAPGRSLGPAETESCFAGTSAVPLRGQPYASDAERVHFASHGQDAGLLREINTALVFFFLPILMWITPIQVFILALSREPVLHLEASFCLLPLNYIKRAFMLSLK